MNAEQILNKIMSELEVASYSALAEKLNTTQSSVSGWKSRNAIGTIIEKLIEIERQDIIGKLFDSTGVAQTIGGNNSGNMIGGNVGGDIKNSPAKQSKNEINEDIQNAFNNAYRQALSKNKLVDLEEILINFALKLKKENA